MAKFKVYVLGSFQVTVDDSHLLSTLKTDKSRALFAYLFAENDHPHRRAKLIDLFWMNSPDKSAHNSLRQSIHYIHKLSAGLDPSPWDLLASTSDVQLKLQRGLWVDAFELNSSLRECEAHHPSWATLCSTCLEKLALTVGLYHGDFLDGFSLRDTPQFDWWLLNKREQYHQKALKSLAWLTDTLLYNNDYSEAVNFAQKGVELFPWCEPAHQRYMKALALAGERGKALHQFEICKSILSLEVGIEPSAETRYLCEKIRTAELDKAELLPITNTESRFKI